MKSFIKKYNNLLLVVIISVLITCNTFAAAVADNDGSAFITKTEFDSLKSNFQSQINEYNTSIDNKIDTAIASYLAGVTISSQKRLVNYVSNAKEDNINNLGFMKWGTPKEHRSYYLGYYDVEACYVVAWAHGIHQGYNRDGSGLYNYVCVANFRAYSPAINFVDYKGTTKSSDGKSWTGNVKDFKSAYYFINFPFKGEGETYKDTTNWSLKDVVRHRLHMKLEASNIQFRSAQNGSYTRAQINALTKKTGTTLTTDFTSIEQPTIKEGADQGKQLAMNMQPFLTQTHTWSQFDKDSDFSSENDEETNKFLKYNISGEIPDKVTAGVEYEKRDYYKSDNLTRTIMNRPPQNSSSMDGSYPGVILGSSWQGQRVNGLRSWNGAYNDITFSFKWKNPKYYSLNYRNLTNEYYNNLFVKPHYKYYGVPLTNVVQDGKLLFTLEFDNSTADDYTYCIMDKKFDNGAMPTTKKETVDGKSYDRVLKTDTIRGTKGVKEIKFQLDKEVIFDKSDGDYIYIKIEPSEDSQLVTVDCKTDIMLETKK